jgi:hypothetical protein
MSKVIYKAKISSNLVKSVFIISQTEKITLNLRNIKILGIGKEKGI